MGAMTTTVAVAKTTLKAGFIALSLGFTGTASADVPYRFYRSPAYFGYVKSKPVIYGRYGWTRAHLNPAWTRMRQLDRNLRGNDGRLRETLLRYDSASHAARYDAYGYPLVEGAPSLAYLEGQRWRRRFFRRGY